MAIDNGSLLTTKDVQALINVDKSTIYRMAERGGIPAVKVGRQWRFPADQIERWLNRRPQDGPESAAPARTASDPTALFVPAASIQSVADLAGQLLGLMAVVTDMDGRALCQVANPCGFYAAVQELPEVLDRCIAGWKRLGFGGLAPEWIPSHLGFLCARTFIRVDSRLVGMVIVGGLRPDEWPPRPQLGESIAADLGVDPSWLTRHLHGVHDLDPHDRDRALKSLPKIADLITSLAQERRDLHARFDQIAVLAARTVSPPSP